MERLRSRDREEEKSVHVRKPGYIRTGIDRTVRIFRRWSRTRQDWVRLECLAMAESDKTESQKANCKERLSGKDNVENYGLVLF
jgi:hypothetical protein